MNDRLRAFSPARILAFSLMLGACASSGTQQQQRNQNPLEVGLPTQVPDTAWGTHVLVVTAGPRNNLWVGTYGRGIFVFRSDSSKWEQIQSKKGDSTSISWNFVNSFAFPADSSVWYGTIGNGWGRSTDRGKTWKSWQFSQLGPEWQYVIPDGLKSRGDTVYIGTADGIRITNDGGNTYRCIQATSAIAGGSKTVTPPCAETFNSLPSEYLLSFDIGPKGEIWVGTLFGVSVSTDRGKTFKAAEGIPNARIRSVLAWDTTGVVWAATENAIYKRAKPDSAFKKADIHALGWPNGFPGGIRAVYPQPGSDWPVIVTSFGLATANMMGDYRLQYLPAGEQYRPVADIWDMTWWGPPTWPIAGSGRGLNLILAGDQLPGVVGADAPMSLPRDPIYPFFERPIRDGEGNPYIDQTYRYGSTMGGNFQQHQGVEFNNPAGTPVHPIAPGVVVFAGPAEAGANTVAIRHDTRIGENYLFSVYYHNSSLTTKVGDRVSTNDVIARVGNSGRATNDHMHLEVHVAPSTDSSKIVNPAERFPAFTTNPQLWIRPMPGTGIVAGRVRDAQGKPVPGARVHGLVLAFPEETPFSFAETYRDRAHSTPGYDEDFAVSDVPAGTYLIGIEIAGAKVWRRVRVEADRVTTVEFSPLTGQ
ncbi:MAG TPA: peptidoglycan DD-metalloendopeptidase family protein [Longimicrobiales bacterium]|nr:peptidoglycan DD-metalloendopeptidase family protein [Longimicrobiales bacterium]